MKNENRAVGDWETSDHVQRGMRAKFQTSKALNDFDINVPCTRVEGGLNGAVGVLHPVAAVRSINYILKNKKLRWIGETAVGFLVL